MQPLALDGPAGGDAAWLVFLACAAGFAACCAAVSAVAAMNSRRRGRWLCYCLAAVCAGASCFGSGVWTMLFVPLFSGFVVLHTRAAGSPRWLLAVLAVCAALFGLEPSTVLSSHVVGAASNAVLAAWLAWVSISASEPGRRRAVMFAGACAPIAAWAAACDPQLWEGAHADALAAAARVLMQGVMGASLFVDAQSAYRKLQANADALERASAAADLATQQLHQMAYQDRSTGFPNRNYLLRGIADLIARSGPPGSEPGHALMLVACGNVKDTAGRKSGDALLGLVGERLGAALPVGTVIAKMDGDEFGILLRALGVPGVRSGSSADRIAKIAGDLRATLARPFIVDGDSLSMAVSVGHTLLSSTVDTPELVLQRAALALHAAKETGGDTTRFLRHGTRDDAERRRSIEAEASTEQLSLQRY